MTNDKMVGIAAAAEMVGVHPNTLRKWADQGLVPHMKLPSGHRRFSVVEMEKFRCQLQVGSEGKELATHNLAA